MTKYKYFKSKNYRANVNLVTESDIVEISDQTGSGGGEEKRHEFVAPYSYCGTAPNGTAETASLWTIKRIEVSLSGTTTILTATNVAWTDRLTVTYS